MSSEQQLSRSKMMTMTEQDSADAIGLAGNVK